MKMRTSLPIILSVVAMSTTTTYAQVIDFETVPGNVPPMSVDNQVIDVQYGPGFKVTFSQVVPGTGGTVDAGFPRIAKVGPPLTAFTGCTGPDTPLAGQGLGDSFLTYSTTGVPLGLLITYTTPVSAASGVLIDSDCRDCPPPCGLCEQWTITARTLAGTIVHVDIIDAPRGAVDPTCSDPSAGPGDALAIGWSIPDVAPQAISSILIEYTGDTGTSVGIAFDNFNTTGVGPPPPTIPTVSAWGLIVLTLLLAVTAKLYFGRRHPEATG